MADKRSGDPEQRRCGRPTRTGSPCAAIVRRSAVLDAFAPACGMHLSDEEKAATRTALWSEEGQVLWALEQRNDAQDLASAQDLTDLLRMRETKVQRALRELQKHGTVAARKVDRRSLWGTTDQVMRWDRLKMRFQAEMEGTSARVLAVNSILAQHAERLDKVCHPNGVSVDLRKPPDRDPASPARHLLVLAAGQPDAAAWLSAALSRPTPAQERTQDYVDQFDDLLGPLELAGWRCHEEGFDLDQDDDGPVLSTTMFRTCMLLAAEYRPFDDTLTLTPFEMFDEDEELFSILDSNELIALDVDPTQDVTRRAGELGLLEPTRVTVTPDAGISLNEFVGYQIATYVVGPAAHYRDKSALDVAGEIDEHPYLKLYLDTVVGFFGSGVLPDLVPDSIALGIAAWCWRNNTAVEEFHLPTDVLMARVNLAVTRAAMDHIDEIEGVDWAGLINALTDDSWALPDGRTISTLFGAGWGQVQQTVAEQLRHWQAIDADVLGPEATLRLLSIGGTTGYTDRWWGRSRWSAMCAAVVADAISAEVALPSPYHHRGSAQLIDDLSDPGELDDAVLEWMIDLPGTGVGGPQGLRFHSAARPITRTVDPPRSDLSRMLNSEYCRSTDGHRRPADLPPPEAVDR
ncbi:hypothetical protein F1D05_10945 [Kribbella qitaiheensis]|uniref:Uncharacterized protein n=1 Tax=Kribbella qitaiheensis TaxID=1544730 RepID=A0A7G6WWF1_9ACTN|nr:hypothetical protein [Kribbella qitaiheensis]QNE18316.1 hypothetical protein F1D05_10945 [Kribbella qitaiheensis]